MALFVDLVALSNGLHGSVQMDLVALFSWIGWLRHHGIFTNLYFIWIDYKKLYPDGYQYTQFKHYFKQWLDENHLESNLRMAINRVPGEIMYIDWAGDTLDLVYTDVPGELQTAHFFTTTLGVSSYCFVMAFPNEQTPNFLQGTIEALNFYGGVPKILKPDNTKAASIKNTKDVLILNKVYEDLQDYYNTVIVPAPPLKPGQNLRLKTMSDG